MFARHVLASLLLFAACACSSEQPLPAASPSPSPAQPPVPGPAAIRVLMLTATAGFRHDSIATARQVMAELAAARGEFTVTATEDLNAINTSTLGGYDVLFFALTSGELAFNGDQKAAIVNFVRSGGGFLGAHSATDTLYEWQDYGAIIGAYFKEHPWTQQGTVLIEDQSHPATTGLGDRFSLLDTREGRLFTGEARGCNVARLVQVELEPSQAVAVLLGEVPVEAGKASVSWDEHDGGREVLSLELADGGQERIWLDGRCWGSRAHGTHHVQIGLERHVPAVDREDTAGDYRRPVQ